MKKYILLIASIVLISNYSIAQSGLFKLKEAAFESQVYPAGIMPGLRADFNLNDLSELNIRIGANIADRQDWGEHDNEVGDGYGFSVGYRYNIKSRRDGPFMGVRVDLWQMTIDWKDFGGPDNIQLIDEGSTDITILQPTFEFGWKFKLGENWRIAPNMAFGQEINIKTDGEDVGQGGISLFGFTLGKVF